MDDILFITFCFLPLIIYLAFNTNLNREKDNEQINKLFEKYMPKN